MGIGNALLPIKILAHKLLLLLKTLQRLTLNLKFYGRIGGKKFGTQVAVVTKKE